ncbi:MAG: IS5 family transposase [Arcticibacterium sp.]
MTDGLVSIDQPHVKRFIVRGKTASNMEFEAKIQITLMSGYVFLDELFWDGFN